jgi:hypothetical protein
MNEGMNELMHVSRNEVLLGALKASRGARLPNGLAEDVAGATLWLCEYDFAGLDVLHRTLSSVLAANESRQQPSPEAAPASQPARSKRDARGSDADSQLVAYSGPSWIDLALAERGKAILVAHVDEPWMLLGLAGHAARVYKTTIAMQWDNHAGALLSAGSPVWIGPRELTSATTITVAAAGQSGEGLDVDPEQFARIHQLAARTYVPATDESRLKGAGAGLVDND